MFNSASRLLVLFLAMGGAGYLHGCGGASHSGEFADGGFTDGGILVPGFGGGPGNGGASGPSGSGGAGAPQCGDPGTPCCPGNDCNGGGCCVSGICMAVGGSCVGLGGGVCNAGSCGTCGGLASPCCTTTTGGTACSAGGTKCSGGACVKCGGLGELCCAGTTAGSSVCTVSGATCINGSCSACGLPGTPCCPGNQCGSAACCYSNTCIAEATACGATGGACQAGRCSGCGGKGQPCCSGLCYDGYLCKNSTCTACGGLGETCCPAGGTAPQCQAGMACSGSSSESVCARCGLLGDVCCAGSACAEGCCSGGRCLADTGACPKLDAGIATDAPMVAGGGGAGGSGGIAGSGGIIGSGGSTSTSGCGATIDDMEAGTGKICSTSGGRKGMWFTYVDTSATSIVTPAPESNALPALMSTPRTSTSKYAMHVSGTYSTYAGMGCWLNNTSFSSIPGTYSASSYQGIRFFAKGTGSLIVVAQVAATEPTKYGGTCSLTECAGNSFKVGALSGAAWTEFAVPFSGLTGGTAAFSASAIWSLEFQYYSSTSLAGAAFDLWIDDLSFY